MQNSDIRKMFGVDDADIEEFKASLGYFQVGSAELSDLLLAQLSSSLKYRTLNTFAITDLISRLEEGKSEGRTKAEEPFKGEALKGLWKAHFFDSRFIARNLLNYWKLDSPKSGKFGQLLQRVMLEEQRQPSEGGWPGRLSHAFVIDAYKTKANKRALTGEWLVFGKHNNRNYYLCIAEHTNSCEEDAILANFIRLSCLSEYPFLFKPSP